MSTRMRVLQVLLGFVCVSHLFFGVVAFMGASGPVQAIAARFYGADLDMNAQLLHVIRMLGAFMLAMAVLSGLGAFRPQQSGPIVIGLVVLLCLRVLQRVIFSVEVREAFGVSAAHLWVQSLFFFALAVALFVLMPRGSPTTPAAPPMTA